MRFERLNRFTHTLRFRLTLWNSVVVLVAGLVTLIGLREGVRLTLIRELDQLLLEDLKEIQLALREDPDTQSLTLSEQLDRKAQGHSQHEWFAQLVGPDGSLHYSSKNAPSLTILSSRRLDIHPSTIQKWRVVEAPAGAGSVRARVGVSLLLVYSDVSRIDRLVTMAACVIFFASPVCGYWLAGRATKPLAHIIGTMARLRPSKLDERLPLRNTGDELDRLSLTFNKLLDRIASYLDEKRDFLANAAHELRTPVAAIRSSVEVAMAEERSKDEYRELFGELISEAESLEWLLNQLLLLAETEVERLKIHGEPLKLDELVQKSVDMFRGAAEFRGLTLHCTTLPQVTIDGNRQHIRQVLNNLLDNAIKFTAAGGKIHVSLHMDSMEPWAVLSVADTGIGIAPEDLPHIFERFYRVDRARRRDTETRGTGLGLAICRAIV
jgi:two-component system, OmpR family, heavy metal sensor histidine kinase CusS